MFSKNPTQLVVPPKQQPVFRRLLLRNTGYTTVVCKLIVSNPKVVSLKNDKVRVSAGQTIVVDAEFNYKNVGMLDYSAITISGFVLPLKQFNAINISHWLNNGSPGCPRQQAFQLTVSFSNDFSSRDTVLEIPGQATLVVGVPKSIPYNEQAEADTGTANAFGSYTDLVLNKDNQSSCWFQNFLTRPKACANRSQMSTHTAIEAVEAPRDATASRCTTGSKSKSSECGRSRSKSRQSSKSRRSGSKHKSVRGSSKSHRSSKSQKSRRSSKSHRSSKSAKSSRRDGKKASRSSRHGNKSTRSGRSKSRKSCGSKMSSKCNKKEVDFVA